MNYDTIMNLISSDALELYGQPKWTFGKNTCNTYEVFPEKIHLPSGEVMPSLAVLEIIAKDERLSLAFSRWFLDKALASIAAVSNRVDANLTLSLNLLPLYAAQESFVSDVLGLLEKYGLAPQKLQFELSEAQDLTQRGIENLNILHDEHGVLLYLGNFGKGHSNVDLLSEVHFDGIELNRSYAAKVPDHEQTCRLVVAIQHLAHTLDLAVCAKGIENHDQFEFFEELGCEKGQGFLIGTPMPLTEMEAYVEKYAVHRKH